MAGLTWHADDLSYRDSRGRTVSDADVRAAVERITDAMADDMARLARQLRAGEMTQAAWRDAMANDVKLVHLAAGMAANGGRAAMTASDWGFLGHIVRDQYAFLRGFVDQIANGTTGTDQQIERRARMYATSARLTYEATRDRAAELAGFDQEMNILGGTEHHCTECPSLSAQGWVTAGTLPPIGARTCGLGCKCHIARRRSAAQEAA
jgi:hypothetical protein